MQATPRDQARPDSVTLLAFVGVVVAGGLNAVAVKETVAELAPLWGAGVRFVAASVLLFALVAVTRRPFPRGASLTGAMLYGLVSFAGTFGFVYPALRQVPAATAIVFLAMVPLLTFGLAILHGQERFRAQGLIGAMLALGGVAIVVANQLSADIPLGPMLMVFAGAAFLAEGGVILKWVPRSDPFATNAVAMGAGGVALLAISLLGGESWRLPQHVDTWLAAAYLIVIGSIVLFGLYLVGVRRWTASGMSYVTLLQPLVTIPVAALLLSEKITLSFVLGGALALVGVYVGAFLHPAPRHSTVTSLPECLPIEECPPPVGANAAAEGTN